MYENQPGHDQFRPRKRNQYSLDNSYANLPFSPDITIELYSV